MKAFCYLSAKYLKFTVKNSNKIKSLGIAKNIIKVFYH